MKFAIVQCDFQHALLHGLASNDVTARHHNASGTSFALISCIRPCAGQP